jgi:hypothetical protein
MRAAAASIKPLSKNTQPDSRFRITHGKSGEEAGMEDKSNSALALVDLSEAQRRTERITRDVASKRRRYGGVDGDYLMTRQVQSATSRSHGGYYSAAATAMATTSSPRSRAMRR